MAPSTPRWWSICQLVCTEPGTAAIVLRLPPKQGTVLWPNSGRVNGLLQQVFLPGTVRSGEAVLVQRCLSRGRAMKMDVGRGEKSYLCHLTSPGSLYMGFLNQAQSYFSPDTIEHGGLTGRGPGYDKAVPVSDSSGQARGSGLRNNCSRWREFQGHSWGPEHHGGDSYGETGLATGHPKCWIGAKYFGPVICQLPTRQAPI